MQASLGRSMVVEVLFVVNRRDSRALRTVSGTDHRCPVVLVWCLGGSSTVTGTTSPGTNLDRCLCRWVTGRVLIPPVGDHGNGFIFVLLGEDNVLIALGLGSRLP